MSMAKGIGDLARVINRILGEDWPTECERCGKNCHFHICQQCDNLVTAHCVCAEPEKILWCSSNCRAAFDL